MSLWEYQPSAKVHRAGVLTDLNCTGIQMQRNTQYSDLKTPRWLLQWTHKSCKMCVFYYSSNFSVKYWSAWVPFHKTMLRANGQDKHQKRPLFFSCVQETCWEIPTPATLGWLWPEKLPSPGTSKCRWQPVDPVTKRFAGWCWAPWCQPSMYPCH